MDDKELDELDLENSAKVEYEDQEYSLKNATITDNGNTRVESVTFGGKVLFEKTLKSKWFYIGAGTFLTCFYVFVIIIAFLVKTTDGMEYAAGKMDENEQYTQIYTTVEDVVKDIQTKYGVTVNKYLIISSLTVFMNNHYYKNLSGGAFNYVNIDDPEYAYKTTTAIKNFAEILAKYQIVTNKSCDMPSKNYREIASNDDDGMTYFTSSASEKEKNYDCTGGAGYKVSYKQGILSDEETGSAFYWNMLDENFFNNYYPEYFGKLTKNGSNPEQYYKAADEVLDYIYLYANYLKELDKNANSCKENPLAIVRYECETIKVLASENYMGGEYSLEDYVAGVIARDAPPSLMAQNLPGGFAANKEVMKEATRAYAIAVRTYTVTHTNGCRNPISSSGEKEFKPTNDPFIISAVKDTEGVVITYNNEIISAEYDSYKCKDNPSSCEYTKVPSKDKHTISIPATWKGLEGGEGKGLSAWANVWYIYNKNWTYQDSLKFFYADGIELKKSSNATSIKTSGTTCSASTLDKGTQAKDFNALGDKAYKETGPLTDGSARAEWINKIGPIVEKAQYSKYGIKNSLIIAQIINKSEWMRTSTNKNQDGTTLVGTCNNVLSINYDMGKKIEEQTSNWAQSPQKCANCTVSQKDSSGKTVKTVEDMRKYSSIEDCIEDYANIISMYLPECKNNNSLACYKSFIKDDNIEKIISDYSLERFDR